MDPHSQVVSDLSRLRSQLQAAGSPHRGLLQLDPVRPVVDILFDACVVAASVAGVLLLGWWLAPLAVCVIGNRQRALGNILHDAGHRNLWRNRRINDAFARAALAPLLFASLTSYRDAHFRHHVTLGDARGDPDRLPVRTVQPRHWSTAVFMNSLTLSAWWGSVAGHLVARGVAPCSQLYIASWWTGAATLLYVLGGSAVLAAFLTLWISARATTFHLITMFREMCDHYGLQPGGVLSFTRDLTTDGLWRQVFHPRNNGYHLTHHLLPAVPYYLLPQAHALFASTALWQRHAKVCDGYFTGERPVVADWQRDRQATT